MFLRALEEKDADGMLEWMKDESISRFFRFCPDEISLESVLNFIRESHADKANRHYAIINEEDEYLGTISLKNIDNRNRNAEYAISLRKCSIGTGVASYASAELLHIAFHEFRLHKVYLNVLSDNTRAVKFYEKSGFILEGEFKEHLWIRNGYRNLKWYGLTKEDFKNSALIEFLKY